MSCDAYFFGCVGIYEINIQQTRLVIRISDYDLVMERERTMKRKGSRKLRAKVPRTLRTVMFCLHAEVFLGVFMG